MKMYTVKTALSDFFQGTVGETRLRESILKGEIPHTRIGKRIILREAALLAWMEEQERTSSRPPFEKQTWLKAIK